MKTKRNVLLTVLSAGATLAFAAQAAEPTAPADVELEPITVIAPVNPLDRSLQLLRAMVDESAPCLGCDAVLLKPTRPRAATVLNYLLAHRDPNKIDPASYLLVEARTHDAPDLEYLQP